MSDTTYKKKLIEVALPLDEINAACKADKDRKTGTIRNLHKWFAPMPLPAWRALLFASLVDDPEDDNMRVYYLDLIKRLVASGADLPEDGVIAEARRELARQFPDGVPTVMDPFCGGGSTLVEAQRLALPTFGSDLNPVPTLITRTLTQVLPPTFGKPALAAPGSDGLVEMTRQGVGFEGVAADVARYGQELLDEALTALGSWFPEGDGVPVAWLWVRTARCANPVCGIETPLSTSWWLSKKPGERAWIEPEVRDGRVHFRVESQQRSGGPNDAPKLGRANFECVACGGAVTSASLRAQAAADGLGLRMTAAVETLANGARRYRSVTAEEESCGLLAPADGIPSGLEVPLTDDPRSMWCVPYGLRTQADLYTPRQLAVLTTFSDLVASVPDRVRRDGGSEVWVTAVTTVLALALGQMARSCSTQSLWRTRPTAHAKAEAAFGRNDMPMMWDFAETYFAGGSVGDWVGSVTSVTRAFRYVVGSGVGAVVRADARVTHLPEPGLVATDPPYFDAIGYADLSDFFYVWHRRALRAVHSDLYGTMATPKANELTALAVHHGGSEDKARSYFIDGFTETFTNLKKSMASGLPMLVVYASKEQKAGRGEEIRWSAILSAMLAADLEITGTWPVHGTSVVKMNSVGANVVSAYIVMVCRPRPEGAGTCSLADFNRALRRELGSAVRDLQAASILPVDLAQAAMGPGMQIYSRYRAVVDQSGNRVAVEQALGLINAALAEVLDEQEGELDAESRFAVRWWETHGWSASSFGDADKTARPLGLGVDDVVRARVVTSQANKVQLLGSGPLDRQWRPSTDIAPTAWEAVHHLADRLVDGGGELEAARLMAELGSLKDPSMALAYRLHDIAAKRGRTADQERYNALISSWTELVRLSGDGKVSTERLF